MPELAPPASPTSSARRFSPASQSVSSTTREPTSGPAAGTASTGGPPQPDAHRGVPHLASRVPDRPRRRRRRVLRPITRRASARSPRGGTGGRRTTSDAVADWSPRSGERRVVVNATLTARCTFNAAVTAGLAARRIARRCAAPRHRDTQAEHFGLTKGSRRRPTSGRGLHLWTGVHRPMDTCPQDTLPLPEKHQRDSVAGAQKG